MVGLLCLCLRANGADQTVHFDSRGNAIVHGSPFFPIGLFTYSLDDTVISETHRLGFNTVTLLTENHAPKQLDWVAKEKLMAVCPPAPAWLKAGTNHPALLAWYLSDEPEGHGITPAMLHDQYLSLKKADPNHPIALDHFLWDAIPTYKDACDVTMTSYYPVIVTNPPPIINIGLYLEHSRTTHTNQFWPHWPFIQIFGGPDCEDGKWRQPEPLDVRAMVYCSLIHRANGIFYFSYWPKATNTWSEVGALNHEIQRLSPWLLADGSEISAQSSLKEVQVRVKSINNGKQGLVLLLNGAQAERYVEITIPNLAFKALKGVFDGQEFKPVEHKFNEHLKPYGTRACFWGDELK